MEIFYCQILLEFFLFKKILQLRVSRRAPERLGALKRTVSASDLRSSFFRVIREWGDIWLT